VHSKSCESSQQSEGGCAAVIGCGFRYEKRDLDTNSPLHHGAIMRLTINLDDDLYAMARSHAIATKTSISKAVGDLLRRRTEPPQSTVENEEAPFYIDPVTLLPVVRGNGTPLTNEDVLRMIEDDDIRHPPAES
jgi:Arc/MetJ family transcription regulator